MILTTLRQERESEAHASGAVPPVGVPQAVIEGKFLFAQDSSHTTGSTDGEETHTLTIEEMPSHRHATHAFTSTGTTNGFYTNGWYNASGVTDQNDQVTYTGGDQAHNNMPPYLAVYCWKRTA